jgi:NitT/TauT family transport system substrate-binding protein
MRLKLWSLSLLAALTLAAGAAQAQTKLIMQAGSAVPSAVYIPLYIAQQVGFFKDEGLEVEARYVTGGPVAAQLAARGDADIAHIVFDPVVLGYDQGLRGRFFYQTYTRLMYFVAVPPESPIKAAADLRGTKVGVVNLGSAAVTVTKSMATLAGMPADSVTFIPTGIGPQALAALTSKQVDALALWDAVYATYEASGHHLRYLYHPTLKDNGNGGFFASEKTIAEKRKALEGFSRAIAKATVFLMENPAAAVHIYWKVNPNAKIGKDEAEAMAQSRTEMKFVSQAFDVSRRPGQRFGALDDKQVQGLIDLLVEDGTLKKPVPAQAIITQDFVPAANDFDVQKARAFAHDWK